MSLLKRLERMEQEKPAEPKKFARPPVTTEMDKFTYIFQRVQDRLISEIDLSKVEINEAEIRRKVDQILNDVLAEEHIFLSRIERDRLFNQLMDEILGYGPIQPLLNDDTINEVMVNGPYKVYIERDGKIEKTNITFRDSDHLMRIIDRILAPLGRRVDESCPYMDARLPDGSRVNVIIPPLSLIGPVLTIRKFAKIPFTVEKLIELGTVTPEVMEFLKACVIARLNIVISGGTGSGKTTFLNVLSGFIPNDERIITIENAAELQLRQEHVVTLETRPPNIEGKGEVTMRDLVINALRMRPDRIIVGEVRGGEALDMLQAMNTGHDGSLTTLHANSPRDALSRIETMVLMAGVEIPIKAIRQQVASALDLIIHMERMKDGSRKVVQVTEVQGMEGDTIVLQDIFVFEQQGIENGRIIGRLRPTGVRPKFMEKIEAAGIYLPPEIFGVKVGIRR
ncbi:MAG: CpaF family protein [Anaerolineae bacterium]|nr:CpaF family protein [Anaerolineae bacterium]MDW8102856.1 CpaF family protein [Anaerolineae bacterium]